VLMTSRGRQLAWALSVAVVLADSSIVTLALPEILREYDTSVFGVSWVLTSYNLVLAATVIGASRLARRRPSGVWTAGMVAFAAASVLCAIAPSIGALIVGRCAQALGGAAAIAGAIELLALATGSHERAARTWGVAGTLGLALGPAAGGLLTELISWQAIFLAQVPVMLLLLVARGASGRREAGPEGVDDLRPEIALGLLSAGLTAALFLLVILLTEGWGLSPIEAAAVVSVIPAATLLAGRINLDRESRWDLALAGAIALAGGLAALGLLPGRGVDLAIPPQLLIGAGLALSVPVLTAAALGDRDPHGSRAAATLAARHAGIVLGIVVLTPILSLQLTDQHQAGRDAGTALLLDAPLSPTTKLRVGTEINEEIDAAEGQLPSIREAFARVETPPEERPALDQLERDITDQLERAATHAFTLPFLGAALITLLALIPLVGMAREARR
jgi:MFS family permease